MTRLNVGCGRHPLEGWINLDSAALPGVDLIYDLERCAEIPLALDDNSVDEFLLSHVIEHIHAPLSMMQELWRVAKPDAICTIRCPHGASDDAWEDQTHVRGYFPQSFGYFSQPYYWKASYNYTGDWQPTLLTLLVDPAYAATTDVVGLSYRQRNVVREMVAILRAVKPIREPLRELQRLPKIEVAWRG